MAEGEGPKHGVRFADAVAVWARVAALSFGGPAGQIAVMHRIVVDEKRWVGDRRFLHALNFCMLLPGPEAHQLAIYLGWLLHGVRGGLVAGLFFVLPGFVAMMALSAIYVAYGQTDCWPASSSASRRRCSPSCCRRWSGSAGGRWPTRRSGRWRRSPSWRSSPFTCRFPRSCWRRA